MEEAFRVLNCMYLHAEYPDHDACALNRELVAFSLMEEDDCATQCQFAEKCRTELKSKSGPLVEEKILFQHHTLLDRHMVSVSQSKHNSSRSLTRNADSGTLQGRKLWISSSRSSYWESCKRLMMQGCYCNDISNKKYHIHKGFFFGMHIYKRLGTLLLHCSLGGCTPLCKM